MLTDFWNFSIVEFIKKFGTNWLSECPPHLKRVATLPCEMTVVTNSHFHIKTMHSTAIVTNKMSYSQFMKNKFDVLSDESEFCSLAWEPILPLELHCHQYGRSSVGHFHLVYRSQQFRGSYAAVFWVLLFSSFSREIQQVISYSYNL